MAESTKECIVTIGEIVSGSSSGQKIKRMKVSGATEDRTDLGHIHQARAILKMVNG